MLIGLLFAAAVAVWLALSGCLRPDNVDDAWALSFAYNHLHKGIDRDFLYADGPADGTGLGVELFHLTHAALYGTVLDRVGWTKAAAFALSTALMALAVFLWYGTLRRLGGDRLRALVFCGMLALAEPVVSAGQTARVDALTFLLASLAVRLAAGGRYLLAGVAAGVAFETHPAGLVAFLFAAAAAMASVAGTGFRPAFRATVRKAIPFAAGAMIAFAYYLLLHGANLDLFALTVSAGNTAPIPGDNPLYRFFCTTRYCRNVPELVLFVAGAVLFVVRRRVRECPFASWLFVGSLLALAVVHRPNFFYALYFYPAFLLMLVEAGHSRRWLIPLASLWLALALPRYALAYWQNDKDRYSSAYLDEVRKFVPADALPVFGGANDWFAFKERDFRATAYCGRVERIGLREFYVIEDDDFRRGEGLVLRDFLAAHCAVTTRTNFTYRGREYRVLKATVRPE